jgi:hypothetical protein
MLLLGFKIDVMLYFSKKVFSVNFTGIFIVTEKLLFELIFSW